MSNNWRGLNPHDLPSYGKIPFAWRNKIKDEDTFNKVNAYLAAAETADWRLKTEELSLETRASLIEISRINWERFNLAESQYSGK